MTKNSTKEQLKSLLDKHPEEFKKIGFLFYALIRIEHNLNILIGIFFCEFNQTKNLIFNQALLDEKVFPALENKRRFLLKIIHCLAEEAKENSLTFNEKKWQEICNSIQKLQETRNNLAHKFITFPENDTASYILRKSYNRIKEEKKQDKKYGSFETKKLNLNEEINKAEQVFQNIQKLLTEFLEEAFTILHAHEKNLYCCKEAFNDK